MVAATVQKTFSGGLFALGVTDRRLLLMPLDRRLQPKGDVRSIAPEDLVAADVERGRWGLVDGPVGDPERVGDQR